MRFVSALTIRPLGPEDAESFLALHRAAVHDTASGDYPPDILDAWSGPITNASREKYRAGAEEEVRIGAFDGEVLAGLGCLAPCKSELRACYVHPDYGRMGVGSKVVQALELIASGMGLKTLTLDSSFTAERFYAQLGYGVIERGSHRLSNGTNMPSIKMQKALTPVDDIEALIKRNAKAEADKAWETSWTRRGILAVITYIIVAAWLTMIGVAHPLLHALVPVAAYLLAIYTLPMLKTYWLQRVYNKELHHDRD